MTAVLPEPGTRLVLVPGLRVVEHGRDGWQVGIDPRRSVRLPRGEPAEQALAVVAIAGPAPEDGAVRAVLGSLLSRGLLVPLADLGHDAQSPATTALAREMPADLPERRERRRAARVRVLGSLGASPDPLLRAAGLACVPVDPTVAVVLATGEVDRGLLEPLVRAAIPHLVVRITDGIGLLGPFVDPGRTACLRCLDLHRADDDPGFEARVGRYAAASTRPRADGLAEPLDLAQATLLTAWAVREVVTHVDGSRPPTWSATVRIEPGLDRLTAVSWLRHPRCGCAWVC